MREAAEIKATRSKDLPWREHLEGLPDDIRQAILDNAQPCHDRLKVGTLMEVISVVVRQWDRTPQGWLWWRNLHNKYAVRGHELQGIYSSDGWEGWSHGLSDVW